MFDSGKLLVTKQFMVVFVDLRYKVTRLYCVEGWTMAYNGY